MITIPEKILDFLMLLFIGLVFGLIFGAAIERGHIETRALVEVIEKETSIRVQDVIIYPVEVNGLSIQKYAIATNDGKPLFEYAIRIGGPELYIHYATFEEAESVMINLANRCGI